MFFVMNVYYTRLLTWCVKSVKADIQQHSVTDETFFGYTTIITSLPYIV